MDEFRFREAERRLWGSVGLSPTERRLHLDSRDATVRIQEVGEGPTVLFVHGAANGGSSWAELIARLDDLHCVVLDRPGCCLSDPIEPRLRDLKAIEEYADALIPEVLDALELAHANVVATSLGGYFALRAAAAHPHRIDRIVQFGWTVGAPMAKVPLVMRFSSVPVVGWIMARVPPNERAVRMILRQIGLAEALESGRFSQEAIDWFLALLRDTPTMRNEQNASPRVILPIHGMNERVLLSPNLLGGISTPTRFIWGTNDPNGGTDIAQAFVARLPNAELEVLPGAGHAPWIDEPDRAALSTRTFFTP